MQQIEVNNSHNLKSRLIFGTAIDKIRLTGERLLREDLFYILSAGAFTIAPLRERKADIPQLTQHFCTIMASEFETERRLSKSAIACLQNYDWPRNITELENIIRYLFTHNQFEEVSSEFIESQLMSRKQKVGKTISLADALDVHINNYFDQYTKNLSRSDLYSYVLAEIEHPLIKNTLKFTKGNQSRAAQILGINRNTLRKKIKDLHISSKRIDYKQGC